MLDSKQGNYKIICHHCKEEKNHIVHIKTEPKIIISVNKKLFKNSIYETNKYELICIIQSKSLIYKTFKNNYEKKKKKDSELGLGVFNGEMGIITEIDDDDSRLWIRFDDGKIAPIDFQDLEQIEHSYAITIHKSQGSEFNKVILPIVSVSPILLTRNVLYSDI